MNFDAAPPPGKITQLPDPKPVQPGAPAAGEGFGKVYDLMERRRGVPEVPMAVWDEVDRAAAIARSLQEQGRAIRFSEPEPGGRVRAELTDRQGNVVRPMSLGEVITIGSNEPPTAA